MNASLRGLLPLTILALLACSTPAQRARTVPPGEPVIDLTDGPELWVSGYNSNSVHRFSGRTGDPLPRLTGVRGAQSIRKGPDGLIYVVEEKDDEVRRYRRTELVDVFVRDLGATPEDENGPLNGPTSAVFGPDGNLYVGSFNSDAVLRYHGSTGAYLGVFVASGVGGLDGPDAGMVFGPDGDLYVPSFNNHRVLRYDGQTGAFLGQFASPGEGGLQNPRMLLFLPDGHLWVSSWGSNRIIEYDENGELVGTVVTSGTPTGFALHPTTGDLFVASDQTNRVNRFDAGTKQLVEVFVPGSANINGATYVYFFESR